MNMKMIVDSLRKEMNNPASNAVLTVFATRQRARGNINLNSLYHRMVREGFKYQAMDYVPVIRLLAALGFGDLDVDYKGKIRGIKNIKVRLQSIGKAAHGETDTVEGLRFRRRFRDLPAVSGKVEVTPPAAVAQTPTSLPTPSTTLSLELSVNGKVVHMSLPKDLTSSELANLIQRLQSA